MEEELWIKTFSSTPSFKQYRDEYLFQIQTRFNGFFSRNNLPRIKGGAYVIKLDDLISKEAHWVSLFIDKNLAIYFDSFGNEYIPQ